MSVTFFTGKPGGGKSLLACRVIIKELMATDRHIITNVPLNIPRLVQYVRARYGYEVDPDRIHNLEDSEVGNFFLYRAGRHRAEMPAKGTNGEIDYGQCVGPDGVTRDNSNLLPVLHVVDEAHNKFGARDWATTGKPAMWYLSQHRHFGDDVIFVTQHWKNVDSSFRRLAQEFTTTVNLSKRKMFGIQLPAVFMLRTFDSEPTPYATEVWTETHKLDVEGLASCYRTVAVKSAAGFADTKDKKTGLHWGWGIAAVVLLLAGMLCIPILMGKGVGAVLNSNNPLKSPSTNSFPVSTNAVVTNRPAPAPPSAPVPIRPAPVAMPFTGPVMQANGMRFDTTNGNRFVAGPAIEPDRGLRLKFFIRRESFCSLGLENGDVLTVGDGRLQLVGQLAIVDGLRAYRLP